VLEYGDLFSTVSRQKGGGICCTSESVWGLCGKLESESSMSDKQVTVKPESGALKFAENAAKDLKGAIDGGLEKAMSKVLDLVKSTADPALGILVGQLNSETSEARMALMSSLMDLVQSESVQSGLTLFNTTLNESLIVIAKIVTEITKTQDKFGLLDDQLNATRISINGQTIRDQTTDNDGFYNPPRSGEIVPSVGTVYEPAPKEYEWWDPRGWTWAFWNR
jgi:hypothetical protein